MGPAGSPTRYTVEVYTGIAAVVPGQPRPQPDDEVRRLGADDVARRRHLLWRVRRLDADGLVGPWSAGRSFELQAAAPTLISPLDGAGFQSKALFFDWLR